MSDKISIRGAIKTMADCPAFLRRKTLEKLKADALAELERRGYEVRGKTPAKIRQILKRRPTKPNSSETQIAGAKNK